MSLEDFDCLQNELCSEARESAENLFEARKQLSEFIISICRENYEQLKEIFREQTSCSGNPEKKIYDCVYGTVSFISDRGNRSIIEAGETSRGLSKENIPQRALGWIEIRGNEDCGNTYYTPKGKEIVDKYREISRRFV
jgi:hypothetical protein